MVETDRQWVLTSQPEGKPTEGEFELEESEVPEPGPDEVLVRTIYLSVDPYMRGRRRDAESYAESWERSRGRWSGTSRAATRRPTNGWRGG